MAAQAPRDVGAMRKRWNTDSVLVGLGMDVWDQTSDADSFLFRLRIGPSLDEVDQVTKFSVHKDGTVTATAFVGDGSLLTGVGGGGSVSDAAFDVTWNAITNVAPSKNATYDQFVVVEGLITTEAGTRAAADTALDGRLDAIEADYTTSVELAAAIAAIDLSGYATDAELTAEAGTRAAADTALDGRLDAIELDYTTSVELAAALTNVAYVNVTNAFTARQTITGATLNGAATDPTLTLTQTWNTTGAPSALRIVVTDNASDASSEAIAIVVDGIGVFGVRKDGTFITANAIMESVAYGFTGISSSTISGFSLKETNGPYLQLSAPDHIALQINEVTKIKMDVSAIHPETNNTMTVGTATEIFLGGYFTTLEIGHATDTTIARSGAGRISVEGSNVLLASDIGITVQGYNANLLDTADIGVSVQAYDADLATIAGLAATTDNFIQSVGSAWASRTPTQATATLINFVGDSGAGGTKGLVPAPAAGDAVAGKYLDADGTWTVPPTGGAASDVAYDATTWNGNTDAPTKNVVRDKFETLMQTAIAFGNTGTAGNDTVYLTTYAPYAATINSIQNIKTTSGTVTATVNINGVGVTGLGAIAVTSTVQDVSATAANSVAVGDEITLVLSSASSPIGLRGTLVLTRT